MKAIYDQLYVVPLREKVKKKWNMRSIWNRINGFFGLETTADYVWFYGLYGISLGICLFTIAAATIMDGVYR
ncbi:MAG: DUF3961 domain-containing protein [Ectobacillus sp.]